MSKPERSPRPRGEDPPADKRHKAAGGKPQASTSPSLNAFFESQNGKTETAEAYAQHLEADQDQELALKVKFLKAAQQYAKAHGKKIVTMETIAVLAAKACRQRGIVPQCMEGEALDLVNEMLAMGIGGRDVDGAVVRGDFSVDGFDVVLLELWLKAFDHGNRALTHKTGARCTNPSGWNPSGTVAGKAPQHARDLNDERHNTIELTLNVGPFEPPVAQAIVAAVYEALGAAQPSALKSSGYSGTDSSSSMNFKVLKPLDKEPAGARACGGGGFHCWLQR